MNEYQVTFFAPQDGGLAIDIHNSTGTSPVAAFSCVEDLRKFFSSLGIQEDRLAEIEKIYSNLSPGTAYHDRMFLPGAVIKALEKWRARANDTGTQAVAAAGAAA